MGVCAHLQGRGCRVLRPGPTLSPRGRRPRPVPRVPSFALKQGPVLLSPLCALRNLKSSAPILPRPACKHPGLPGRGERGFSARARQRAAAVYGSSHFRRTHGAERSVFRWERRVTQSRAPGGQRPRAGDGRAGEDRAEEPSRQQDGAAGRSGRFVKSWVNQGDAGRRGSPAGSLRHRPEAKVEPWRRRGPRGLCKHPRRRRRCASSGKPVAASARQVPEPSTARGADGKRC